MKQHWVCVILLNLLTTYSFAEDPKGLLNYHCQGLNVAVGFEQDKARVVINHYAYILERSYSASGSLYLGDVLSFWDKGQKATLIYSGDRSITCKLLANK
ncbi:MliC family protein [Marinomonas ostreistagni]|uniref:MliC family protein n=1 Tax=Marinomonas ostreistagni TaxID=359209 RepID=A0ABS0ZCK1_9GAMM|nr:MliC family protein [Marinomonas ostreistagni]MBJ7551381.1 MliC family protein [Marinomonas ostreistagni]